jgi:hypothetical protein
METLNQRFRREFIDNQVARTAYPVVGAWV